MFSSDRGKALTQRLNSLALSQESHIAESYGNKATAELKRLLEGLIEKAKTRLSIRSPFAIRRDRISGSTHRACTSDPPCCRAARGRIE
jgi:hypothetical protein